MFHVKHYKKECVIWKKKKKFFLVPMTKAEMLETINAYEFYVDRTTNPIHKVYSLIKKIKEFKCIKEERQ